MNEMSVNDRKLVGDVTTKFGQYRRYQSCDSQGEYRLRRNKQWKRWVFNFLRKRQVERSDTGEFNIGQGVTWWSTWKISGNSSRKEERYVCNLRVTMSDKGKINSLMYRTSDALNFSPSIAMPVIAYRENRCNIFMKSVPYFSQFVAYMMMIIHDVVHHCIVRVRIA